MKKFFLSFWILFLCLGLNAQRMTDALDRGLVVVHRTNGTSNEGTFVSWRILANEYYDVTYNVYRDGVKLNDKPLSVSNYNDTGGSTTSEYTVSAIVKGVEQPQCKPQTSWNCYLYKLIDRNYSGYKDITLQKVYSNADGSDITADYQPNDISMADLDGDGQLEILLKRLNTKDASSLYLESATDYAILEAYKLDGTRMWWIDCGPNMVSLNSTEIDIVAYDWDCDGKAEVVLRGADGMKIHFSDGTTKVIGDASVNSRNTFAHTDAQYCWTHTGNEYLLYLNGETGKPYQIIDYPLKRLEDGETDLKAAWGDDYGHRSSKYFFGAPFLDGRKASLFLARGIYTREKMIAYDINPQTHEFTTRWTWNCNQPGSEWYGNGYHNFCVADVDMDGRDEIVYGSMVIDDNGKGLSTTGLGHGDSQHVGDFDPYRHGLEFFGCNEDKPGNNYRNATTSEMYYRFETTADDGRALIGKFSDSFHGCQGRSSASNLISSVTDNVLGITADTFLKWSDLNFRIYWDGDLCDEVLNSPGTAKEAKIEKPGYGRLFTSSGCNMNNDSKNNPCFQGDILGDWREEFIVRCGGNLRIYTTTYPTEYHNYTLWHDTQYRQSEVWQMEAYNQTPHTSYFLGKAEGITMAPPPSTLTDRVEIADGASISKDDNDKHLLLAKTDNMSVSVVDGAAPYIVTDNAPTWVEGHDDNANITTTTYTHTITGGAFTGEMRLIKQGDGILKLPNVSETYTGNTDVWNGELDFDGNMVSSRVWLNRFASLKTNGGKFGAGIVMDYASQLLPQGDVSARSVTLNFGSRIIFPLSSAHIAADTLRINKVDWTDGPKYLAPVIQFTGNSKPSDGAYLVGTFNVLEGNLSDIIIEGISGVTYKLEMSDKNLYLVVGSGQVPTGINNISKDVSQGKCYNIEGMKMPDVKAYKGVYIKNGVKVMKR